MRGMMEICKGWVLLLCWFLCMGASFTLGRYTWLLEMGVILSCFGMSQVCSVILGYFLCSACDLLFSMQGHVPFAPAPAKPEPYLGSLALAKSFPGPWQSIFGTLVKRRKKKQNPDEKCKHFFCCLSLSISVCRMTVTHGHLCVCKRRSVLFPRYHRPAPDVIIQVEK